MKYTDEELLKEIREADSEVEGPPTGPYFDERDGPGTSTVTNRFGKWTTAKRKAGVDNVGENGKLPANDDYFEKIDTSEKAYWLGVLYGDGSINDSGKTDKVFLGMIDRDHIEKFKTALDSEHKIIERDNGVYGISVTNQKIVDDLNNWGIDSNKTHSNTLPDLTNEENRAAFVRGFFDADGNIGQYDRFRLSSSNRNRLEKLLEWLPSGGVVREINSGDVYGLFVRNQDGLDEFWNWVFPDGKDTEPALERKLTKIPE
jgi:intein/homing endonuclease